MESKILSSIGIKNFDPAIIIIILLVIIIVMAVIIVFQFKNNKKIEEMDYRLRKLCMGRDAESLEDELDKLFEDNNYLMTTINQQNILIKNLNKRLRKTYQKTALVKYDAFDEMGGKLSFVLVLLDEKDNGYMINSVHSNNCSYVYSKEIINGQSSIELGDEEYLALEQAKAVQIEKPQMNQVNNTL